MFWRKREGQQASPETDPDTTPVTPEAETAPPSTASPREQAGLSARQAARQAKDLNALDREDQIDALRTQLEAAKIKTKINLVSTQGQLATTSLLSEHQQQEAARNAEKRTAARKQWWEDRVKALHELGRGLGKTAEAMLANGGILIAVLAAAVAGWYGQYRAFTDVLGLDPFMAGICSTVIEVVAYVAFQLARVGRRQGDSVRRELAVAWLFVGIAAALQASHAIIKAKPAQGDQAQQVTAEIGGLLGTQSTYVVAMIMMALMSIAGPVMWEMRERRLWRNEQLERLANNESSTMLPTITDEYRREFPKEARAIEREAIRQQMLTRQPKLVEHAEQVAARAQRQSLLRVLRFVTRATALRTAAYRVRAPKGATAMESTAPARSMEPILATVDYQTLTSLPPWNRGTSSPSVTFHGSRATAGSTTAKGPRTVSTPGTQPVSTGTVHVPQGAPDSETGQVLNPAARPSVRSMDFYGLRPSGTLEFMDANQGPWNSTDPCSALESTRPMPRLVRPSATVETVDTSAELGMESGGTPVDSTESTPDGTFHAGLLAEVPWTAQPVAVVTRGQSSQPVEFHGSTGNSTGSGAVSEPQSTDVGLRARGSMEPGTAQSTESTTGPQSMDSGIAAAPAVSVERSMEDVTEGDVPESTGPVSDNRYATVTQLRDDLDTKIALGADVFQSLWQQSGVKPKQAEVVAGLRQRGCSVSNRDKAAVWQLIQEAVEERQSA